MEKLKNVKQDIESTTPQCPEIRVQAFDFSENDSTKYDELQEAVDSLPNVDVLINNVGMSYKISEYFNVLIEKERESLKHLVNINVVSTVKMTNMVYDRMIARNRGIIINVG